MPGFFVSNKKIDIELHNVYPDFCVSQSLDSEGMTVKRNTLNKFMKDKAFADTDSAIVIADGYILNKLSLFEQYGVDTVESLFVKMHQEKGDEFFADLRGSFSGAFYDKKTDKWLIFTNHIGDSAVYYIKTNDGFIAGSQVNYVLDACRKEGVNLTFDEQAAYQMITHAFMIDDTTYAKEIKRLVGGTYLCVSNGSAEVKTYHVFNKNTQRFANATDEELINEIDKAFSAAAVSEYDKDIEYGYAHLTDISGGLDSRMTLWVAHTLGYGTMQLVTYCKGNYLDEIIAKQIAAYWKDEILVKQLDDAQFLYDIDEIVFMNGGLSLYSGISGGNRLLKALNSPIYGLEHTGINGNNSLSSYILRLDENKNKLPTGRYSEKFVHRLSEKYRNFSNTFEDHELYLNYTRAYRGMTNTFQIRRNYTEVSAPFLDIEFIQLCFDIPIERRLDYNIYRKWILAKYPEAAQFKWEATNTKVSSPKIIAKLRWALLRGPGKLFRMIGLGHKDTNNMTPMAYWIENNKKLKDYLDSYAQDAFAEYEDFLSTQLVSDMKDLYETGSAAEKAMVLTVLGSVKLYFGKE